MDLFKDHLEEEVRYVLNKHTERLQTLLQCRHLATYSAAYGILTKGARL